MEGEQQVLMTFSGVPTDATKARLSVPASAVAQSVVVSNRARADTLNGPADYTYRVTGWVVNEEANTVELSYEPLQQGGPAVTLATLSTAGEDVHALSLSSIYDISSWALEYGIIAFPIDAQKLLDADDATLIFSRFQIVVPQSVDLALDG